MSYLTELQQKFDNLWWKPKVFFCIFFRNINICVFVGLILLSLHHKIVLYNLPDFNSKTMAFLTVPLVNGILTMIFYLVLNHYFAKRHYTDYSFNSENKTALGITSFIGGVFCCFITADETWTYVITGVIIYAAYRCVRLFIGKLSALLSPDEKAKPQDLAEFMLFFINLVISFSVINLTLNTIHFRLGAETAFNFSQGVQGILDAVYFSLITMTTVGYGDIYPHSEIARLFVGLECLTSYILLGIMIGIISRGVELKRKS